MKILVVIPARGGSKRLPRKNIFPLKGKPLLYWTYHAAKNSKYIKKKYIFVSTDCDEIETESLKHGIQVIKRGNDLSNDSAWTEPVIRHSLEYAEQNLGTEFTHIAWLNACVPELTSIDIDKAINMLLDNNLREVIAIGAENLSNSAVRILVKDALYQNSLSVKFGVIKLPYKDIHYKEDIDDIEKKWN